jgi:hypothetical protein
MGQAFSIGGIAMLVVGVAVIVMSLPPIIDGSSRSYTASTAPTETKVKSDGGDTKMIIAKQDARPEGMKTGNR